MLYKVVLTCKFVEEILKCDHSHESYGAVLSCGIFYQAVVTFESVDEILKCGYHDTYYSILSSGAINYIA